MTSRIQEQPILEEEETQVCVFDCVITGRFAVRDMKQTVAVGVVKSVNIKEKDEGGASKGGKAKKK